VRANAIVAQTQDQASMLLKNFSRPSTVIPNFHPKPAARTYERNPDRLRVIWVANFKTIKRPELFVALAEKFANDARLEFVMIGNPGPKTQYAALHGRIKTLRNLNFLGELSIDDVNSEIAQSDVLVNTSESEGFANTFIQAWLRKVPVVSYNVDPDGCLSRGGAGIVAGSWEGLVAVIAELAGNKQRASDLGTAAEAYALTHHCSGQALVDLIVATAYRMD